jgi:hypothetical protein
MQDVIPTMVVLTLVLGLGLSYEIRDVKRELKNIGQTLERAARVLEGIAGRSGSGLTEIHATLEQIDSTLMSIHSELP